MSPIQFLKSLIIVTVLGYLAVAESDARTLGQQEAIVSTRNLNNDPNAIPILLEAQNRANLDQADSDDDDDDDDRAILQLQKPLLTAGTNIYYNNNKPVDQQAVPSADLKTSASYHHHGHGAKGWLDMGAWTGKKGAFGWYDKHPVGKGK